MIHADAAKIYEGWRQLWLSGGDSNAIAVLRFHGLRGALAVVGAACNRTRLRPPSSGWGSNGTASAGRASSASPRSSRSRRGMC